MARRKKEKMKYRGFYCDDELWGKMQKTAEHFDEADSEFIRRAIEERVQRYNTLPFPVRKNDLEAAKALCSESHPPKGKLEKVLEKPPKHPKPKDEKIQTFFKE